MDIDITDRATAERACTAVLTVLGERAAAATIDAITDFADAMPDDARAAKDELMSLGQGEVGVVLDLQNGRHRKLLYVFAPWSIQVDVFDEEALLIANFHDCGHDVLFVPHADDIEQMQTLLPDLPVARLRPGRD
ncbi:hypothetical protein [Serinicoccus hydrothermalis]|uniref:hypothetical protein n=1 Tax=Serinicoccus hydrothermalis TaxID=1758689 RepID=UPI0012F969D4|nr:hypothetical protein [Serinicoccus hydrothermalis]